MSAPTKRALVEALVRLWAALLLVAVGLGLAAYCGLTGAPREALKWVVLTLIIAPIPAHKLIHRK